MSTVWAELIIRAKSPGPFSGLRSYVIVSISDYVIVYCVGFPGLVAQRLTLRVPVTSLRVRILVSHDFFLVSLYFSFHNLQVLAQPLWPLNKINQEKY